MSYYLDYINFIINSNEVKVRKPSVMLDLDKVFKNLKVGNIKDSSLTIKKVELCANSKGCTPKGKNGKDDYLVKLKNQTREISTKLSQNKEKYVLLNIDGTYKLGDAEESIHIRVPKSGTIGVRLGMKKQKFAVLGTKSVDSKIGSIMKDMTFTLMNVISGLKKEKPTKLVSLSIKGLNVFNPKTGNRPDHKIQNFIFILRKIDEFLPNHELDYNQRDGKQIIRGNFKPLEQGAAATIGITPWGMTDFMGSSSIKETEILINEFIEAFNSVKNQIKYDTKSVKPKVISKQPCRVGQVSANSKGNCPNENEMYPIPKRDGTICCKSGKLTSKIKQELIQKYKNYGLPLPKSLNMSIHSSIKTGNIPQYNTKRKTWVYKGKQFKCTSLRKPEIQNIATKFQLNPLGKVTDLCGLIEKHLKENRQSKKKEIIKKFKIMSAKYLNKFS